MSATFDASFLKQPAEVTLAINNAESIIPKSAIDRLDLAVKALCEHGVHDNQQLQAANEMLVLIAQHDRQWENYWKPKRDAAHKVHKMMCDSCGVLAKQFKALRTKVERVMEVYLLEQRRIREEQEAELRRQAEALQRQALSDAQSLMERGQVREAKQVAQVAATIVAPILPDTTPALDSTKLREPWDVKITDLAALVRAIAEGKVPLEVVDAKGVRSTILEANEGTIRKRCIELGGLDWPGVECKKRIGFSVSWT